MLKKSSSLALASLRGSTYRKHTHYFFARCGLVWDKAAAGAPGLGRVRRVAFVNILRSVE